MVIRLPGWMGRRAIRCGRAGRSVPGIAMDGMVSGLPGVLQGAAGKGTQQSSERGAFQASAALVADNAAGRRSEQGSCDCSLRRRPGSVSCAITCGWATGITSIVGIHNAGAQKPAEGQGCKWQAESRGCFHGDAFANKASDAGLLDLFMRSGSLAGWRGWSTSGGWPGRMSLGGRDADSFVGLIVSLPVVAC